MAITTRPAKPSASERILSSGVQKLGALCAERCRCRQASQKGTSNASIDGTVSFGVSSPLWTWKRKARCIRSVEAAGCPQLGHTGGNRSVPSCNRRRMRFASGGASKTALRRCSSVVPPFASARIVKGSAALVTPSKYGRRECHEVLSHAARLHRASMVSNSKCFPEGGVQCPGLGVNHRKLTGLVTGSR